MNEDRTLEAGMIKAGVNRIVYPAQLGGGRIAHMVGDEIGLEKTVNDKRVTDVLDFELKVYRNIGNHPVTLHEVEFKTGSLRILTLLQRLEASDPVSNPHIVGDVISGLRDYTIHNFLKLMAKDADDIHPDNLIELLEDWFVDHIQTWDRAYLPYVQKQYR